MDLNKLLKTQWDRTAAIVLTVLGAVFLLAGWIGVSGTPFLAEQAPYILSGGVGGLFFLGLGATLWVSADLRDEWRKLDRIEAALSDGALRWVDDDAPVAAAPPRPARPEPAFEEPVQRDLPEQPAAAAHTDLHDDIRDDIHTEVLAMPKKRAAAGTAKAARTSTSRTSTGTARRSPRVAAPKATASDA